ncbi:hypothetical protein JB92DRAFT_9045 [Gautieria morchelliformis]|nr:hypothetical protein JB92DRAFT_9045 [Gautieria morchelliformis]
MSVSCFSSCQAAHGEQPIASAAHISTKSQRKEILISKNSAGADRLKNRMEKILKNFGVEEHHIIRDDAFVEISMDDALELPSEPSTRDAESQAHKEPTGNAKATLNREQVDATFEDSDADSAIDRQ